MGKTTFSQRLGKLFSAHDLTYGPPWKRILELSIPMLLGNLAQQLYNTVDSIIVGKYIGDNALAAVGNASPLLNLLLALFVGIGTGVGILVAQSYGAKDREQLSTVIGNCITLTAIVSFITTAIGLLTIRPMLQLMDTPASILDWSADYLNIYMIGIAGFAYYNILSGVLRGMGDSVSALGFLLIAALLNVVLDLWFVAELNWGVSGVALATMASQAISAVLCMWKLTKMRDVFHLRAHHFKPRMDTISQVIRIGMPSGATQAIFSTAMLAVQALNNSFGEAVITCNMIVMRIDGFAMMPNFSYGQSMTNYTGQNIGAKRYDRVHEGTRQGTAIAVGTAVVLTASILIFGKSLARMFTESEYLVDLSMHMMRILAFGYISMAVTQVFCGVLRGAGDTVSPMWISIFSAVLLRVPMAYLLAYLTRCPEWPNGRPESTFISLMVSWAVGALMSVLAYRFGKWHKKLQQAEQAQR